jgi:Tol biopolymer transport system component
MKHIAALRMGVVVIAMLTVAFALSASAGALPAAGPSGPHMAFMSMRDGQADIYSMQASGLAQINLTHDATVGLRTDSEPAWSQDGQWIAFQRSAVKGLGSQLFLVKSDGSQLHALMPSPAFGVADKHPNWSPDGKTIVFSSNRTGHFELYAVKASGGGLVRLTFTAAGVDNLEPAWSPDGSTIAFVRIYPTASIETSSAIFGLSLASGITYRMTTPGMGHNDCQPAWSPNSQRIAFESDRAGTEDVYLIDRKGTGLTRVTTWKSNEYHPTWAPDSSALGLISDHSGATEIYTLQFPRVGSTIPPTIQQLTFDKAFKANPAWEHLAPVPGL